MSLKLLALGTVTNTHLPGSACINVVVSNMPEFEHTFSYEGGQPMV